MKKKSNLGPEMLPLRVTCMGELMETAEEPNVSVKKSFLKGDALVKIPSVRSIPDLGKQDLSYLIQLIEGETETKEHLQSKSNLLEESQKIQDLARGRSH